MKGYRSYKRKPDYLLILAVLVGIGVVVTMKAQAGGAHPDGVISKFENKAVYQNAWLKNNTQVNQTKVNTVNKTIIRK